VDASGTGGLLLSCPAKIYVPSTFVLSSPAIWLRAELAAAETTVRAEGEVLVMSSNCAETPDSKVCIWPSAVCVTCCTVEAVWVLICRLAFTASCEVRFRAAPALVPRPA
jgi:hypothetical protein